MWTVNRVYIRTNYFDFKPGLPCGLSLCGSQYKSRVFNFE